MAALVLHSIVDSYGYLELRRFPGISFEFVRLAHSREAKVLIADIQLTREAEEFVATKKGVHFQHCDVRKRDSLQALVQTSKDIWNDVPDIYIAGAGIFEPVSPLAPLSAFCEC